MVRSRTLPDGGSPPGSPTGPSALECSAVDTAWLRRPGFAARAFAKGLELEPLRAVFAQVERDPYIADGTRHKALARCRFERGLVCVQPHAPLYQSSAINPLQRGVSRDYAPLRDLAPLVALIEGFARSCGIDERHEILVQAQRTECSGERPAECAPEGFHRDGIEYLAIACIARERVSGGLTMLAREPGACPQFARVLEPGELLLVRDADWLHYTTPIEARRGESGYRDVILLSAAPGTVNRYQP